MQNPFVFGSATTGNHFTDRVKDSERLLANFRHGVNSILISPRRWGKTSLVYKVSSLAESDELKVVNIDIFSCKNEDEFYHLLATEVIKQTAGKWEEWVENTKKFLSSLVPKISFGSDPLNEFSLSLDVKDVAINEDVLNLAQNIAIEKKIKIVICIDEFQQISEFSNHLQFQKKLRSVWQHQPDVTYCLYGSKKHLLNELFSKQSMPFYKFGDVFFLDKISTSDWVDFIVERFLTTGKSISGDLAFLLCTMVENHSSYVQQLAWNVWIRVENSATKENIEEAIDDLFRQNSMLFYQYVEGLSNYQLNFLRALAAGVNSEFTKSENLQKYNLGTSANVKRLKVSLEKKELIDISGKWVTFNDPVFKLWFKKNIKR